MQTPEEVVIQFYDREMVLAMAVFDKRKAFTVKRERWLLSLSLEIPSSSNSL